MKKIKVLGFVIKSVVMGMIAALFLFTFFPQLLSPIALIEPKDEQPTAPFSFAKAIQKVSPSVVNIRSFSPEPQKINSPPTAKINMGSGIIIAAQGYIATNYHVIADAKEIAVELTDGRVTIAKLIGFDPYTDIAVLKITLDNLPFLILDPDVEVQVGDIALVIGNPFGVGQSVTMGIVSATGRRNLGLSDYENYIQTDAAVNLGNSGGALINSQGDLLGISSSYFKYGTKTGISFTIPTSLASDVIQQIIANGRVIRGWLGFSGGPINKTGREEFGEAAQIITAISPNGPADIAGLKVADVILSFDHKPLKTIGNLPKLIAKSIPGSEVVLQIRRQSETLSITIKVKERPQRNEN